ncbi:hypothetical protein NQ318_007583 [Aromia moschata]|uniref:Uncharacterized protein n=1 Tax=Aromia moschata TaxID=1265417 RepID=A0AAV8YBX4_9CUCU|nr:hypothetical protein NQ318_007583 [Aromia moschata]
MTENKVGEKEMTEENLTEEKVTDGSRSKLMFVLFYALGTLTLVPSSFYITANDVILELIDPNTDLMDPNQLSYKIGRRHSLLLAKS